MQGVNLIPARRRDARQQVMRRRRWFVGCSVYACVLVALCVGARTYWGRDNLAAAYELVKTKNDVEDLTQAIAMLQPRLDAAEREFHTVRVVANQPDWSVLLELLASKLGDDTVLRSCALAPVEAPPPETPAKKDAPRPPGTPGTPGTPGAVGAVGATASSGARGAAAAKPATPTDRYKLDIAGLGRSQSAVSRFVLRLQQTELFEVVKLVKSSREAFGDSQAVAFQIQATLVEQRKGTP